MWSTKTVKPHRKREGKRRARAFHIRGTIMQQTWSSRAALVTQPLGGYEHIGVRLTLWRIVPYAMPKVLAKNKKVRLLCHLALLHYLCINWPADRVYAGIFWRQCININVKNSKK